MRINIRYIIYNVLILTVISILTSCSYVHEWPDTPSKVPFHLYLTYDTDMTLWEHTYNGTNVIEDNVDFTFNSYRDEGQIRYIVRAYPITKSSTNQHSAEFIFTQDIAQGYNFETIIELEPGNYNIMVWSDIIEEDGKKHYYDADNFNNITLQDEEHQACTDYRDAFRGNITTSLKADVLDKEPTTITIEMQRPLAKFEFISDDLQEFIKKETSRIHQETANKTNTQSNNLSIDNYIITIHYVGFMPNSYSLFTDKPTDSATGILFTSPIQQLSKTEASLGFDYVFIKPQLSAITVQVVITTNTGEVLSTSKPIQIPLKRDYHTIIRGKFLTSDTSGGVAINPDYDGDFNLIFP